MSVQKASLQVENIIESFIQKEDIADYEIDLVESNQKGEGFLGDITSVTLLDKVRNKSFNLVIKCALPQRKLRDALPIRLSYENEIYFYSTIYPAFEKLGVPSLVPKHFHSSLEDGAEYLVLDNLKAKGFQTFPKRNILDAEHIKVIFKTYGQFHACSAVLKDQNEEEYRRITAGIRPVFTSFLDVDSFRNAIDNVCKLAETYLDHDYLREAFKKYVENNAAILRECMNDKGDHDVIIHGDCWSNNMLFKYDDFFKPCEMKLIDFQLLKIGNPMCDLSYCFYSGAAKEDFDKLDEYLEIYCRSFGSIAKNSVLSVNELQKQWKTYAKFGMLMGMLLLKIKLRKAGENFDLTDHVEREHNKGTKDEENTRTSIITSAKCDENALRDRIKGIIEHMYRFDAL